MASSSGMSVSPPSSENRFWPDVLGVQELLEQLGVVERHEDAVLLPEVERGPVAGRLHALREPAADVERRGCACTRRRWCGSTSPAAASIRSRRRTGPSRPKNMRPVDGPVEVGVGEAEVFECEYAGRRAAVSRRERVDVGLEVAGLPVPVDEPHDAGLQPQVGGDAGDRPRPARAGERAGELHAGEERPARWGRRSSGLAATGGTARRRSRRSR